MGLIYLYLLLLNCVFFNDTVRMYIECYRNGREYIVGSSPKGPDARRPVYKHAHNYPLFSDLFSLGGEKSYPESYRLNKGQH